MSNVSKGKYAEAKARNVLKKQGYAVDFKPVASFQSQDLFTVFDLLAIKLDHLLFVQVKSTPSGVSTAKRKIIELVQSLEVRLKSEMIFDCEIWMYQSRKPFKRWFLDYEGNNYYWIEYKNK